MTPSIMLVDDELNVLKALRRSLRAESFRIVYENDPHTALRRIERESFAIIMSDFRMPTINGVELLEYSKYRQPAAVRLILSAYADREILLNAINTAEIYRFLAKPWDDTELASTLHSAMARYRQQAQGGPTTQSHPDDPAASEHQATLQQLETHAPGITKVLRDQDGAIVVRESGNP